jgi:hypothetical protein
MTDLNALAARQIAEPIRSRLTIWHARAAFLAVVAKQPKRTSPAGDALAGQCAKLIEELKRQREQVSSEAQLAGYSDHRLVASSLDELDGLLSKLGDSLDCLEDGVQPRNLPA